MILKLTDFLLARIAEDEIKTRELLWWAQDTSLKLQDPQFLGKRQPGWHAWPDVERLCERVLAECEAKRKIIENGEPVGVSNDFARGWDMGAGIAVQLLSQLYADHPDYREEWRS